MASHRDATHDSVDITALARACLDEAEVVSTGDSTVTLSTPSGLWESYVTGRHRHAQIHAAQAVERHVGQLAAMGLRMSAALLHGDFARAIHYARRMTSMADMDISEVVTLDAEAMALHGVPTGE